MVNVPGTGPVRGGEEVVRKRERRKQEREERV